MAGEKVKVYVESSVISAYYYSLNWMLKATRQFFEVAEAEGYENYTSDVTIAELERGDEEIREKLLTFVEEHKIRILPLTREAMRLAGEYVGRGVIPARYRADAEHIAVASVGGVDALVSWNLSHIVKLKTKRMVKLINGKRGYSTPEIIRPDEAV